MNAPFDHASGRLGVTPTGLNSAGPAMTKRCPSTRTSASAMEYGIPPTGGIGMGSRGREMVLTGSAMDETIGVSAGPTTMHTLDSGAISQSARKWYSLHVVVVESSCDG